MYDLFMINPELTERYAQMILPHLELAKKAYGSRATNSPAHDASREYTRLLKEYHVQHQGSLLDMASRLNVAYAGLRRRVTTADLPPLHKVTRTKFSEDTYQQAVRAILAAREINTEVYHQKLYEVYMQNLSMAKIAKLMGLSGANPLHYAVNKVRMQQTDTED